jgi:hypothetical protein
VNNLKIQNKMLKIIIEIKAIEVIMKEKEKTG